MVLFYYIDELNRQESGIPYRNRSANKLLRYSPHDKFIIFVTCLRKVGIRYNDDILWCIWCNYMESLIERYYDDENLIINDKEISDCKKRVIINWAVAYGHMEIVKYLYSQGFRCKNSSLLKAITNGKLQSVKFLYSKGITVSHKKIRFLSCDNVDVVKFLIKKGVKYTPKDVDFAICNNRLNLVRFFYSINIRCTMEGINSIMNFSHTYYGMVNFLKRKEKAKFARYNAKEAEYKAYVDKNKPTIKDLVKCIFELFANLLFGS